MGYDKFEVHTPYCLGYFVFYEVVIIDYNQFGHFFLGKEVLNFQILVRFRGSAGQKLEILHGKKFSGHRNDFRAVNYSIKVAYTYWPDLMLSVSVLRAKIWALNFFP